MKEQVPSRMKFIEVPQPGPAENMRLAETETPRPGPGQVLIRVAYAGVNRPDVSQRKGAYPPPPGASPNLGLEVAGEIAALGEGAAHWRLGDKVCALTPGGGYAEFVLAHESHCLPIPKGWTLEQAAALPENYFTVWTNVFDRGRLRSGETFLVHGGSSGIGLTAIQLAKVFGARVIATAGSERKCERCRDEGADLAINYKTQDFADEVLRFAGPNGVQLILDMVAGPYFPKNLEILGTEGRLVHIATQLGDDVSLKLRLVMSKRLTITGSTLRPRSIEDKAAIAESLRKHVWPRLETGEVKVIIDRVFPLDEAAEAHRFMESGEHIGKILLKVGGAGA